MIKNYLFFLLLVIQFTACNFTTNLIEDSSNPYNKRFDKVHISQLEEGSTIVHTGMYYSFEKMIDGKFLLKYYLKENANTLIIKEYYSDEFLRTREGKAMTWAINGKKSSEGMYQNGKRIGEWKYYDKDTEQLIQLDNYQNGEKNGICKRFFDTGELNSEYAYQNGEMNGVYKIYNKVGELKQEGLYQNGEKVEGATKDSDGEKEEFKEVGIMPMFPGCDDVANVDERKACSDKKMLMSIYTKVRYPAIARENGIEGMTVISFVVEKDGTLDNIQMAKRIGGLTEHESFRVVNFMNTMQEKWKPGMQEGKPVKVHFNLPIKFRLE